MSGRSAFMNISSFRSRDKLERLAVYGVLDRVACQSIRHEQRRLSRASGNDLALRLPVHVTLRGPFLGSRNDVAQVLRQCFSSTLDLPIPILLDIPSLTTADIAWRQVARPHCAWSTLFRLHMDLTTALGAWVFRDDVPPHHQRESFLPHVTLGWGVTPTSWKSLGLREPRAHDSEAHINSLALARYPEKWPASGRVAVEEIRRRTPEPSPGRRRIGHRIVHTSSGTLSDGVPDPLRQKRASH